MSDDATRVSRGRNLSREDRFLRIATPALLILAAFLFLRPSSLLGRRVSLWYDRFTSEREVERRWSELVRSSFKLYGSELDPELVVFSDFECPYCIANVPAVDSAVDAGALIGYIHVPAPRNVRAREAAVVAVCAAQRGQFTEAYDFYIRGTEWRSVNDSVLIPPSIDTPELRICIADASAAKIVDQSIALAAALGINGTPTFASKRRVELGLQNTAQLLKLSQEGR